MPNSNDTLELATMAVDIVFDAFFESLSKIPDKLPDEAKEVFKASGQKMKNYYRDNAIELYQEFMTRQQLEELVMFHNSEIGKSIRNSQVEIQNQINERMKAFNELENESGNGMIGSINIIRDFNDPDS